MPPERGVIRQRRHNIGNRYNCHMRMALQSSNSTGFGVTCSFFVAIILAVAAFRFVFAISFSFAECWWVAFAVFIASMIAGQSMINRRQFVFDSRVKAIVVQDRWFGLIHGAGTC